MATRSYSSSAALVTIPSYLKSVLAVSTSNTSHSRFMCTNSEWTVGVDLRKTILDGYPRDSVIATDIVPGVLFLFQSCMKAILLIGTLVSIWDRVLGYQSQVVQYHTGYVSRSVHFR